MLVLLLASALPVEAARKEKSLSVSVYCVAYAGDSKTVLVKTSRNRFEEVSLSTANIIEFPTAVLEEGRLRLYGPAEGKGPHPLVGDIDLGEVDRPLVVLHPADADGELAYEGAVVEMGPKVFPLGSFNLVNLSPHAVRILHEEEEVKLESGETQIYQPKPAEGELLAITMEYQQEEDWVLLSSARWAVREDRRTLVCFQLDPVSQRMNVKSVPLRENSSR